MILSRPYYIKYLTLAIVPSPQVPAMLIPSHSVPHGVPPLGRRSLAWCAVALLGPLGCASGQGQAASSAAAAAVTAAPRVTPQTSGTNQLIQAVHAVNDRVVWASGHGAVVLRTVDGGSNWVRLMVPGSDSLEFRDVHATSADNAWILAAGPGARSRIYRTMDGGRTWALQFRNADTAAFYDCLTFLDAQTGIAYSDASSGRTNVLRTTDGGMGWRLLAADRVPAPLAGEGAFAASGLCVAGAPPRTAFIATGGPGARLFRSTDAGASWTTLTTPFVRGASAGLTGVAFQDATHGIAVAADIGRLRTDTASAVVGVTSDGGATWQLRVRPPLPGALSGVAWVPGAGRETAVVVGFGGAFYTTDAARTWTTLNNAVFTGVAAAGRTAWMGGADGAIVRLDW